MVLQGPLSEVSLHIVTALAFVGDNDGVLRRGEPDIPFMEVA